MLQDQYRQKLRTPEQAVQAVKSGDWVDYTTNVCFPPLLDAALACTGLEEAYTLWQRAQEEIAADVPWVWLVNVDHLYWVREDLHVAQQKIHPHGHGWSIVNNIDQWSWK